MSYASQRPRCEQCPRRIGAIERLWGPVQPCPAERGEQCPEKPGEEFDPRSLRIGEGHNLFGASKSRPAYWRPSEFAIMRSDDGITWTLMPRRPHPSEGQSGSEKD